MGNVAAQCQAHRRIYHITGNAAITLARRVIAQQKAPCAKTADHDIAPGTDQIFNAGLRAKKGMSGHSVAKRKIAAQFGLKGRVKTIGHLVGQVGFRHAEQPMQPGLKASNAGLRPRGHQIGPKARLHSGPGRMTVHAQRKRGGIPPVIGRRVRNVTPAAAARYIFGYTAAQDISDRTIQNSESQWARCKSFDTFTPLGPYVETKIDPHDLTIQLFQNGQLRQNSNTSQLIFNCFHLVSFVSTNMTLVPGDIILTGTPSGVGPIDSGDRLEVRVQGLTPLVNTVK